MPQSPVANLEVAHPLKRTRCIVKRPWLDLCLKSSNILYSRPAKIKVKISIIFYTQQPHIHKPIFTPTTPDHNSRYCVFKPNPLGNPTIVPFIPQVSYLTLFHPESPSLCVFEAPFPSSDLALPSTPLTLRPLSNLRLFTATFLMISLS